MDVGRTHVGVVPTWTWVEPAWAWVSRVLYVRPARRWCSGGLAAGEDPEAHSEALAASSSFRLSQYTSHRVYLTQKIKVKLKFFLKLFADIE